MSFNFSSNLEGLDLLQEVNRLINSRIVQKFLRIKGWCFLDQLGWRLEAKLGRGPEKATLFDLTRSRTWRQETFMTNRLFLYLNLFCQLLFIILNLVIWPVMLWQTAEYIFFTIILTSLAIVWGNPILLIGCVALGVFVTYYILFFFRMIGSTVWLIIDIARGANGVTRRPNIISEAVVTFLVMLSSNDMEAHKRAELFDLYAAVIQAWIIKTNYEGWMTKALAVILTFNFLRFMAKMISNTVTLFLRLVVSFLTCSAVIILYSWNYKTDIILCMTIEVIYYMMIRAYKISWRILQKAWITFSHKIFGPTLSASGSKELFLYIRNITLVYEVLRLKVVIRTIYWAHSLGFYLDVNSLPRKPQTWRGVFVQSMMGMVRMINDFDPPGFIRRAGKPTWNSFSDTLDMLKELGYPVDPDVVFTPEETNPLDPRFDRNLDGDTHVGLGIRNIKIYKTEEFELIKGLAAKYVHSDTYANIHNELDSVSRYFSDIDVDMSDELMKKGIEETWQMVSRIYANSRITPIHSIWKNWNKKFNFGALAYRNVQDKKNKTFRKKKMTRKAYIASRKNGQTIIKEWTKWYQHFPLMKNITNVFPKSEALPPKKWMKNKIRTPLSPFCHNTYFRWCFRMSQTTDFALRTLQLRLECQINGTWMSRLFERHSRFDFHYAGDFSEFDSTIRGPVTEAIKSIRKKGYSNHKMMGTLAEMIDLTYDSIEHSSLLLPSTGRVYNKAGGLMTGHASTSSDNSIATVFFYMVAWIDLTGKSAKEFVNFNELSCYGDDHILSISQASPKAWNFKNIQTTMSRFVVTLRDEVPEGASDQNLMEQSSPPEFDPPEELDPLPFLSKFSRKPTSADISEWETHMGGIPMPGRIVFHDRVKLLGKAAAGTKTKDPFYRIDRLIGYMYLTAHNKDLYDMFNEMIEVIIRKNLEYRDDTRIKKQQALPKMRSKIPSYAKVLSTFYDPNSTVRDHDDMLEDEGGVVSYGSMTTWDYICNYASYIPDILNPNVLNMGFNVLTQRVVRNAMTWPREFIGLANKVVTDGHMRSLIVQTPYRFLIDQDKVTVKTNPLTLLVRHWVFMASSSDKYVFNPFGRLDALSNKVANLSFIINGRLQTKYTAYSTPVTQVILVVALNWLPLPEVALYDDDSTLYLSDLILGIKLPDVALVGNRLVELGLGKWSSSIPPNFKELDYLERGLKPQEIHVIQAGTGTGKSTALISHLASTLGPSFRKIIVVEPRSKVVLGLVKYMQGEGLDCSGATTNLMLDPRAKVWYVTAQECLLHPTWVSSENLLVLDEAHIEELAYEQLRKYVKSKGAEGPPMIYMTATPNAQWMEGATTYTEIPISKVFSTEEVSIPMDKGVIKASIDSKSEDYWLSKYFQVVSGLYASSRSHDRKFLIFVNDKANIDIFLRGLPGKGLALSSDTEGNPDWDVDYIVSTSVADVAITIPGVTHVITPNFLRVVQSDKGYVRRPLFTKLDPSTKTQRKGRTGRTNNGVFYLVNFEFPQGVLRERKEEGNLSKLIQWTLEGLPLSVLAEADPEILNIGGYEMSEGASEILSTFEENLKDARSRTGHEIRKDLADASQDYIETEIHMPGMTGMSSGFEFTISSASERVAEIFFDTLNMLGAGEVVSALMLEEE
ncbi:RNA-dependent RNA polymerase [Nigrospora oryzae fusarivirus 1]|uniref:RNA-dependent RNA polymerase n=1 Tax=Nigrospora oryzae fusarivirus 1 TaxID=1913649 RepID=A0A1I9UVN9_9VIRU|nr:RNA-dependent RNA polymerase [Nigrospora oryzae fusarivirus 1]APA05125.1 RNA-dependent RNA polymerase [Nigrospora oryzae fusarivirus 1]